MRQVTTLGLLMTFGWGAAVARGQAPPSPAPAEEAAPSPGPTDDDATQALQEHDRYHHHGGVTRLIAMSLDTLEPDDTKKAELLKIQNDLKAEHIVTRVPIAEYAGTTCVGRDIPTDLTGAFGTQTYGIEPPCRRRGVMDGG